MNKTAIKNFAVEARRKLIASVKDKAGRIGITKENISQPISQGEGYAFFPTHIGIETKLEGKELIQRENLINRIKEKGYDSVIEEVAYTWFNRIIAVRFMEVNDYLPSRMRVLSSETKGKFEPDIVTQAPNIELALSPQEIEEIISLKEKNELDKLFRMLFIKQCNELGEILPELFENTSRDNKDYTEILLDISYTHEDGVIRDLLKIEEEDFLEAVEIIGWMYQYYNTEPKDETFALLKQNVKITKERIPSATQLFTPDWIVRYMVENSLGRLWLEGHPNPSLREGWKYYLDEAEQEPGVIAQLETIRAEYKKINPEEIKVIDPCMGSGHILVYAFEVLMQIYESCGYSQRDAARLIVENNLYGLDIDDRAYQLAYFAVMMKGRKFDRRFLTKGITLNLCAIQESNALVSFEQGAGQLEFDSLHTETANYLIDAFKDAKEYGSILNIEQRDYDGLLRYIEELQQKGVDDLFMSMWLSNISLIMPILIRQARIMAQKYDVVVTNPPYMGSNGMNLNLSNFAKANYPDTKWDLSSVFMEKTLRMCKESGMSAMINIPVWMSKSSFEQLRFNILQNHTFVNMLHFGRGIFGSDFGSTAFVIKKMSIYNYTAVFRQLYEQLGNVDSIAQKEKWFFENKGYYTAQQSKFLNISSYPIAYWVSPKKLNILDSHKPLSYYAAPRKGLTTGDNERFVRLWHEISILRFGVFNHDKTKWFPMTKGGEFRRWYGNNEYVVNWENNGYEICNFKDENGKLRSRPQNIQYYFRECISWNDTTATGKIAFRYQTDEYIPNASGPCVYCDKELYYYFGLLNSKVSQCMLEILAPNMKFEVGQMALVPIIKQNNEDIEQRVWHAVEITKRDWDSFETSWDFVGHPLLLYGKGKGLIEKAYDHWCQYTDNQFNQLKLEEETINKIFIEIYGLQDELTPEVEDKDITIRKADLQRDIRSFISYAVGCMFGRYSLDVDGLVYAGGQWDDGKYKTFIPDKDNVIPITDEEYFDDDIVGRFITFVKAVYGEETLEENLDFIANALGNKGSSSREVIRNYFLKDFYKDHVKTYQKRPIYWLFDSGKENGFRALIYLHRYNEDTVGRVRADYLHKTQAAIESAIAHCDMVLESNAPAPEKAKAVKKKEKLVKQLAETRIYDQAIAHVAHRRIPLDLDDGVVVNYARFQGVVVASEGKKPVKIDLLGKIK